MTKDNVSDKSITTIETILKNHGINSRDLELDLLRHLEIKTREMIPIVEKQTIEKILACDGIRVMEWCEWSNGFEPLTAEEVMESLNPKIN